jgi:exopolysaccharide biosynthesis polyprenyl glycosylphosphotransferase
MLKERDQLIRRIIIIIDSLVVAAAFLLAYILRDSMPYFYTARLPFLHDIPPLKDYVWMMVVVIPVWIASLTHFGMYRSMRERNFSEIFWNIFDASLASILIFSAIIYLLGLRILSRTFVVNLFLCTMLLLVMEKWVVMYLLRYIRKKGYNYRVLLIAGSGRRAKDFAEMIETHPHWGLKILGFIDEEERVGMKVGTGKVIGSFKDLADILDEYVVNEVVFILPRKWLPRLENYVKTCERVGVKATIAVDFFNTSIAKPMVTELHGMPFLTLNTTPYNVFDLFIKRLMDIAISLIGLTVSLPVFVIASVAIKLASPGPVFFRQKRCGLYGNIFTLYKFRTMVVDADKLLDKIKHLNESEGPVFHARNDPRVTTIGKILRETSLDELPQLINVLKGDMSIVGPRPPIPDEVKEYERWQRRRLSLRPGIVCTWQVSRRFQPDFQKWMKMDLDYIDNWSLGLDVKILLRVLPALLRGFMHWQTRTE